MTTKETKAKGAKGLEDMKKQMMEAKKANAAEFVKKYNALCEEYGFMVVAEAQLKLSDFKKPEQPTQSPVEPKVEDKKEEK